MQRDGVKITVDDLMFQPFFEHSHEAIILLDGYTFVDCNAAAVTLFGYSSKDELLNIPPYEVSPEYQPDGSLSREKAIEIIERGYKELSVRFDWLHKKKDGSVFYTDITITNVPVVDRRLLFTIIRDTTDTIQFQEQIQQNEKKYRELVENALSIIIKADTNGRVTFINEYAQSFFGYKAEEILGRHLVGTIVPEKDEFGCDLSDLIDNVLENPDTYRNNENQNITKDGRFVWVTWANRPIIDDDGNMVGLLCIGKDVTEKKQQEQELMRSRQFLDSIVSTVPDIIYRLDNSGKIIFISEAVRQYGYEVDEVTGKNIMDFIHPDDKVKALYRINERRTGRRATRFLELRFLSKTGADVSFEINADGAGNDVLLLVSAEGIYTNSGDMKVFLGTQGIARDITERKKTEIALRESEEKYRNLVERANDGVIIVKNRIIEFANTRLAEMLGYRVSEIIGKDYGMLLTEEGNQTVTDNYDRRVKRENVSLIYETVAKSKEGKAIDIELNAGTISYEGGDASFVFVRDITERKKLEAQYLHAQKMETVGRLAGGVAHDFNNLLTVIKGNAELALMNIDADNSMYDFLDEIKNTSDRAVNLTRQLLAFSRQQVVKPKVLLLNDVLFDMDKMLRRLIGEDIELVFIPDEAAGVIKIDPGQIEQIITNLAINARDAMPNGGKLKIETANRYFDATYIREHINIRPGHYVMLAVTDTGIGMDSETQQKIFEPFFTTKGVGKGTGLGLATCYGIVRQNGGYIWVYSEPGEGTTFKVYLPRLEEEHDQLNRPLDHNTLPQGSESILVVEDDAAVLRMTTKTLRNTGYTVYEAENGEVALRMLAQDDMSDIKLVLSDMVMPQMSGKELTQRIKEAYPDLKIIIMSGYTDTTVVDRGMVDDDTGFLQKPFSPQSLVEKVQDVLNG